MGLGKGYSLGHYSVHDDVIILSTYEYQPYIVITRIHTLSIYILGLWWNMKFSNIWPQHPWGSSAHGIMSTVLERTNQPISNYTAMLRDAPTVTVDGDRIHEVRYCYAFVDRASWGAGDFGDVGGGAL